MKRTAYRAGSFYEADPTSCRRAAEAIFESVAPPVDLPDGVVGGLVPHAGWMFSGATAALTLKALASRERLDRVVIFGADHWGQGHGGAVYDTGSWVTPLGEVAVDEELAAALLAGVDGLTADPELHSREHSIEVQLPLMQVLNEDVRIVPINATATASAAELGGRIGELLADKFPGASVIGSTDLTHYGPQYDFTPGGLGADGLEWAKENDRRVLKLIESMRTEEIIAETASSRNACGGGAIAATMAAASALGASRGLCLEYTTSADVMAAKHLGKTDDAVGYAAVVFA